MVQKKLTGPEERDEYHCVYCDADYFITLAQWRKHCKRHKAVKDAQRRMHQNYKIWKAGGFK